MCLAVRVPLFFLFFRDSSLSLALPTGEEALHMFSKLKPTNVVNMAWAAHQEHL